MRMKGYEGNAEDIPLRTDFQSLHEETKEFILHCLSRRPLDRPPGETLCCEHARSRPSQGAVGL